MSFFKRMGSASSSVKSVSIEQPRQSESRASSGKSTKEHRVDKDKEIRELNERLTNAQVLLDQSRRTNLSHEAEILQLQKELGELKSENESLTENNQVLEERLENLESLQSDTALPDVSESLKLKEQEITKLQAELRAAQDSVNALKQRYKSKLKSIRTDSGKSKQESSMKMFELKDEIARLSEENEKLQVKLKEAGYTSNINSDEDEGAYKSSSPAPDSRSNIIIELSTQISEQEYRISSLESQLEEKDQIIAKLQSVKLSPREAKNIIAIEAEKANQEMQELAKELKMLKRKKKRSKVPAEDTINNNNIPPNLVTLDRDLSSLSMDSGAVDLVSSSRSNRKHRQRAIDHDIDIDSLLTPSPTTPSYASSSPLVT